MSLEILLLILRIYKNYYLQLYFDEIDQNRFDDFIYHENDFISLFLIKLSIIILLKDVKSQQIQKLISCQDP